MIFSSVFSLGLLAVASATPIIEQRAKPAALFLAGDSTTAVDGGWGDSFLSTITNGAIGTNFGKSGATTVSFKSGGYWAKVLPAVTKYKDTYTPFVTIQFGHNDQKAAANISVEQFEANLKAFISDVVTAGGTPIITTSLSRRNYSGGKVVEDLAPQVAAALTVASSTGSAFIDLNKASMAYLNSIGATDAHQYNLATSDNTHLNPAGALVFGTLVGSLLEGSAVGSQITPYLKLNETIVEDIQAGKFILPTGGVS